MIMMHDMAEYRRPSQAVEILYVHWLKIYPVTNPTCRFVPNRIDYCVTHGSRFEI